MHGEQWCWIFTALDFETVASSGAAICAAGMAKVRSGIVVDFKTWIVNPPIEEECWNPANMRVNGLSVQDIRSGDVWPEVFDGIERFADGDIIAAHNAKGADLNYLRNECSYYGIDYDEIRYVCTMDMGRILHPEFRNHKLGTMCRELGIDFKEKEHHGAAYDAVKCAELLIAMIYNEGAEDLESLEFNHNLKQILADAAMPEYVKNAVRNSPHRDMDEWLKISSPEPANPGDRCIVCGKVLTSKSRKNAREFHCCTVKCVNKLTKDMEIANRKISSIGHFVHTDFC